MFSLQKYGVALVKVKVTVAILDSLYVKKSCNFKPVIEFLLML